MDGWLEGKSCVGNVVLQTSQSEGKKDIHLSDYEAVIYNGRSRVVSLGPESKTCKASENALARKSFTTLFRFKIRFLNLIK